jgi:hypothetical protein
VPTSCAAHPREQRCLARLADEPCAVHRRDRDVVALVDAQDVPEQVVLDVLPVAAVVRRVSVLDVAELVVVGPAAVTDGDVQVAIAGPEQQGAGVVVELRLVELEQRPLRRRIRAVRVCRRNAELRDPARVVLTDGPARPQRRAVIDEQASVVGIVRVERQAEETALVERRHQRDDAASQIEERLRPQGALGPQHADRADLIHDEHPVGPIVGADCRDWRREAVRKLAQPDRGRV